MKLPTIQYQQRGPLARTDPGIYTALGNAQARAAQTITQVAGNIYEQESVSEMEGGLLNYSDQMELWRDQQKPYQEDAESGQMQGAWIKGPQDYEDYETTLRDEISQKQLTTPLAQRLFQKRASELNLRNKISYRDQLQSWQKEHQVASVYTVGGTYLNQKKFEQARTTYADAATVGTITESQAMKNINIINYEEKYFNASVEVDKLQTPQDAIDYREKVNAGSLKDPDKNKVIAAVDQRYLNARITDINNTIHEAESVKGSKAEGYQAGVDYYEKLIRQSPQEVGGDEQFHNQQIAATYNVLARYKPLVVKQSVEDRRERNVSDWLSNRTISSPTHNAQSQNDYFATSVMNYKFDGATGFNKNFDDPNPINRGVTTPDFLDNKKGTMDEFINISTNTGFMPSLGEDILNASLTHNNAEYGSAAAYAAYRIGQDNPTALWRRGNNNDLVQVATMTEVLGGGEKASTDAVALWKQTVTMSSDERKMMLGSKKEVDTFFADNFEKQLEKQYQRDTPFWDFWTQTTPEQKRDYQNKARALMDDYVVINQGNLTRGLQSSIIALKGKYTADPVNGAYQIMRDGPMATVEDGTKNEGAWLREQLILDVKADYGNDYDTDYINVQPVEPFDPADPAYFVYDDNPDNGFRRLLSVEKFDYKQSAQYKELETADRTMEAANKRTAENAKLRAQWEIDNPPGTRAKSTRRGTRIKQNPYGKEPGLTSAGKKYQSYGKGVAAMMQPAKDLPEINFLKSKPALPRGRRGNQ